MFCPKCPDRELARASVPLQDRGEAGPRASVRALGVDLCGSCGGAWFDAGELDRYLDASLRPLSGPKVSEVVRSDLDRRSGKCPRGHGPLQKKPAPSNPRLTLDVCGICRGSWVDGGELGQVSGKDLPFAERMKAAFGNPGP